MCYTMFMFADDSNEQQTSRERFIWQIHNAGLHTALLNSSLLISHCLLVVSGIFYAYRL